MGAPGPLRAAQGDRAQSVRGLITGWRTLGPGRPTRPPPASDVNAGVGDNGDTVIQVIRDLAAASLEGSRMNGG